MKRRVKAWGIFRDRHGTPILYSVHLPATKYELLDGWYWMKLDVTYDDGKPAKPKRKRKVGG